MAGKSINQWELRIEGLGRQQIKNNLTNRRPIRAREADGPPIRAQVTNSVSARNGGARRRISAPNRAIWLHLARISPPFCAFSPDLSRRRPRLCKQGKKTLKIRSGGQKWRLALCVNLIYPCVSSRVPVCDGPRRVCACLCVFGGTPEHPRGTLAPQALDTGAQNGRSVCVFDISIRPPWVCLCACDLAFVVLFTLRP